MSDGAEATMDPGYRPIGGAEIGRCPTRLHHDRFTPGTPVDDPIRTRFAQRGIEFEQVVLGRLASVSDTADLRPIPITVRGEATDEAIASGAPAVLGARLEGIEGDAVGMPDILVRSGAGYLPVEVKSHKVIGESGPPGVLAGLSHLGDRSGPTVAFRSHRKADLLQVAHYAALLDERGLAPRPRWGGVIGTDEPLGCVWVDLDAGEPSVLEEHAAKLAEARAVVSHGLARPTEPLVRAAHRSECRTCPWADLCIPELRRTGDPTLLRGVSPDDRTELAEVGIRTIDDVATVDPDAEVVDQDTVFQARAMSSGRLLRLPSAKLDLPPAPIEVDLDIETYGETTYLAGLAVNDTSGTTYESFVSWTGDDAGERTVLEALFRRLDELASRGAVIYHWTDYEVRRLSEGARRHDLAAPGGTTVEAWFEDHAVDLWRWSRDRLVSPNGHSLKTIAPLCGFQWRDDNPGGLQSELWFEEQLGGDRASRDRILRYNEDDVMAQVAVRAFVRGAVEPPDSGATIPPVDEWPLLSPSPETS